MLSIDDLPSGLRTHIDSTAAALFENSVFEKEELTETTTFTKPDGSTYEMKVAPGSGIRSTMDHKGNEQERFIEVTGGYQGLKSPEFAKLKALAQQILKQSALSKILSEAYILGQFFIWLKEHLLISELNQFSNHLLSSANLDVREYTIYIPIANLKVQTGFSIGPINFRNLSRSDFESFAHKIEDSRKEKVVDQYFSEYRQYPFAYFTCTAEIEKAKHLTLFSIDRALLYLRLMSPTAFYPELLVGSFFAPLGEAGVPESVMIVTSPNDFTASKKFVESRHFEWGISDQNAMLFEMPVAKRMIETLFQPVPTELEKIAIDCLLLFSENVRARDPHMKLVLLLVLIETLFLANESEPIQHTLGLRLAFFLAPEIHPMLTEKRIEIDGFLRTAYKSRSGFLHHGKRDKIEMDTVKQLQEYAWLSLEVLFKNIDIWKSKEEMITAIKQRVML